MRKVVSVPADQFVLMDRIEPVSSCLSSKCWRLQEPEPEYKPGKTARDEERERLEQEKELREVAAAIRIRIIQDKLDPILFKPPLLYRQFNSPVLVLSDLI